MALYEIIANDGLGCARIATRQRVDAAALLAKKWAYEQLGWNGLRDRQIAHEAMATLDQFERFAPGLGSGTTRTVRCGQRANYVKLERIQ